MRHDNDLGDLEDLDLLLDCAYEHYLSLSSVIGYRVPFHASQMSRMEVAAECDFQERHSAHGCTVDMSNNTCYFSETPMTSETETETETTESDGTATPDPTGNHPII
jgi:hypothetical protein